MGMVLQMPGANNMSTLVSVNFMVMMTKIYVVIALPLLFICFDPELQSFIPQNILNQITDAYSQIASLPLTVYPVQQVLLHVTCGKNW